MTTNANRNLVDDYIDALAVDATFTTDDVVRALPALKDVKASVVGRYIGENARIEREPTEVKSFYKARFGTKAIYGPTTWRRI